MPSVRSVSRGATCRGASGHASIRPHWRAIVCAAAICAMAAPALAQTAASKGKGTVERIKVPGAALAGNLEGDSPERDVFVYLPPGYATNRNARYPVVYLLHGYGLTAERWMTYANVAAAADAAIASGAMKEMILVSPDAYTVHGGSMYSASPTTGDWETFIAEDLVAYIDKSYRTLADRQSRGLAGHSMGGYGTLRIGMKRPDVFSSMYPMSSCCLIDGAITGGRGRGGAPAAGRGAASPGTAPAAAPTAPPAQATPPSQAAAGQTAPQGRGEGGRGRGAGAGRGFGNVQLALSAAWAPNPSNPPNYSDPPAINGEPQPLVVARYAANSPFVLVPQYVTNLKKYKAITLDIGLQDGLIGQNRQLVETLKTFGVPHTFETYEGDHGNKVAERMQAKVLPFFSSNLSFTAPRR